MVHVKIAFVIFHPFIDTRSSPNKRSSLITATSENIHRCIHCIKVGIVIKTDRKVIVNGENEERSKSSHHVPETSALHRDKTDGYIAMRPSECSHNGTEITESRIDPSIPVFIVEIVVPWSLHLYMFGITISKVLGIFFNEEFVGVCNRIDPFSGIWSTE